MIYIVFLLIVVMLVFLYKTFSSVEIKVGHKGMKRFMFGVEIKDEGCAYYKEWSLTIGIVIVFITITFTK